ncbi:unnamed protein product [Litomosoides sigmodontis]|uniref:RRM domain-containing protein n=1 Tax=Litomosoides sigmodontis TaxID=42156 RepID=A0A3P6US40_LITSI|nr:unnamed protein product [Litomosoides sigmodontis]
MTGEFDKHAASIHKNFNSPRGGFVSRGGNRGRLPRGSRHGRMSPKGRGDRDGFSSRGRDFGKGGSRRGRGGNWNDRGGRGGWNDFGRGGRGKGNQERGSFSANGGGGMDFKKRNSFGIDRLERKSAEGRKNGKHKKSVSEPSTPAAVKFTKYEMDSEYDENEEMSTSDMEHEEIRPSKNIAADTASKQKKISFMSKNDSKFAQVMGVKAQPKKGALKREKHKKEDEELITNRKVKKARMTNVDSEEDDEEENDDEDEDEGSDEDAEETFAEKNVNGAAEMSESDDDEESLEDEDEEELPSEVKSASASTPGSALHYKSALKTPGTGKLIKKVSLSSTTTTPEMLSKNKTPVTPHPQVISTKNKVRRLKFEESDESDDDDEEESDDEKYDSEENDEKLKTDGGKMKIAENGDSDDDEDEDEDEVTDDEERENDEDGKQDNTEKAVMDIKQGLGKANRERDVETIQKKKDRVNLKELGHENDKGIEEKSASQKQSSTISSKEETKGTKRKWETGPVLKLEDAKDVVKEEQKRREERDKKSLFVRGLPKDVKVGQLKALHNDILYVRHMPHRNFAWLIFASEKLCEKAYEDISKQTVEGRTLTVDFCGAKAKTRPQKDRSQLPINPLELFVGGLPPSTSKDQMKVIFRQATNISFPKQARNKNKLYCFVQFGNENEARAAFEKGKTLKISGVPVDVLYARIRKGITDEVKPLKAKQNPDLSSGIATKSETKNLPKVNEVNGDTTSEGIESSEEGIEEAEDYSVSKPKKVKLAEVEDPKILHKVESLKQKKTETKCTAVSKNPKLKASSGKVLSGHTEANPENNKLAADKDENKRIADIDDDNDDDYSDGDDDDDDDDDGDDDDGDDEDGDDDDDNSDNDDDDDDDEEEEEDEEDGDMEDSDGSN